MGKRWLSLALVCLAPLLAGGSCHTVDTYRTGDNLLGVVKLGPFPAQSSSVGGYNLYFSKKPGGPFKKINTDPVLGGSSLMVPYLKAGEVYYFRMTSVGRRNAALESRPGAVFQRKAVQSWN